MDVTLSSGLLERLAAPLAGDSARLATRFPGDSGHRQPVHTVYGGAHLFKADTATRLGELALAALAEHAPDADAFARAYGGAAGSPLARRVHERVLEKLRREPVEDFRIDFEDGFGTRPDAEEDATAVKAATETAAAAIAGRLPPFFGIRIKSLADDTRRRAVQTLDLFVTALARQVGARLPPHFAVTLPKITLPGQVTLLAELLDALEDSLGIPRGWVKVELMIETPQSIANEQGALAPLSLVQAGRGRVVAAHFGTYDYTASLAITAAHQHMLHPACDFARHALQVALAGTGVWLSDGATNILPVGPRESVHRAWALHYQHVRSSLAQAYYQGWDLHPAQLPTRYAAVFAFFLESLDPAAERLRTFVARASQATLVGDVFDDAATGQGLLNFFLRAINCGAVTEQEAEEKTGMRVEELRRGRGR